MDEDAIDTEALQAQIDLSMSFAQNLVSSWIQPHNAPRNPHRKDLEKELSEYMQRPARLGVGAAIQEGCNSATRETARLKGKLAGTKRSRQDQDVIAPQQPSDNEGESRAIAIKKRPKRDPFDVVHGKREKKKKKREKDHEDAIPQPTTVNPNVSPPDSPEQTANQSFAGPKPSSPMPSPSKKKKKRKKIKMENGAPDVEDRETGASSSAPLCNGSGSVLNPPSTPSRSAGALYMNATPKSERTVDVSLTSTPALMIQHKSIPHDFLARPLLNLNGPPLDPDFDHAGTPSNSPKKKRKRRRKKKNALMPSATGTTY